MDAWQARMFVEQVLSMPNELMAGWLVQQNVAALDDTFFLAIVAYRAVNRGNPLTSPIDRWGPFFLTLLGRPLITKEDK